MCALGRRPSAKREGGDAAQPHRRSETAACLNLSAHTAAICIFEGHFRDIKRDDFRAKNRSLRGGIPLRFSLDFWEQRREGTLCFGAEVEISL